MDRALNILKSRVADAFERIFGKSPRLFRAPGRVNLIGEHTDYNGGFVLPAAIDRDTIVGVAPRDDRRVSVFSIEKREATNFELNEPAERMRGSWTAYVEGTIRTLDTVHGLSHGMDMVVSTNIPLGSGLSSSGALEVAVGTAAAAVNELEIPRIDIALAAQTAENEFVGTRSGVMDQFASIFGREGNALLIDCESYDRRYVPLELPNESIIVCNTLVKHDLATGEYNLRRAECDQAVRVLKNHRPSIESLRDATEDDINQLSPYLTPVLRNRSRHVVTENRRVLEAAAAIESGDLTEAGRLMYESHDSLRDLYEVSSPELDTLVELARSVEGVYGARMTGGGFGGCTVNIVRNESVDEFRSVSSEGYAKVFGFEPQMYQVRASDGAGEL